MSAKVIANALQVLDESDFGSPSFDVAAWAVEKALSSSQREVLKQLLFHGPVWDGDICSKDARNDLIGWGLAVRCCFKGEQGFTAATYIAYTVFKAGKDA